MKKLLFLLPLLLLMAVYFSYTGEKRVYRVETDAQNPKQFLIVMNCKSKVEPGVRYGQARFDLGNFDMAFFKEVSEIIRKEGLVYEE